MGPCESPQCSEYAATQHGGCPVQACNGHGTADPAMRGYATGRTSKNAPLAWNTLGPGFLRNSLAQNADRRQACLDKSSDASMVLGFAISSSSPAGHERWPHGSTRRTGTHAGMSHQARLNESVGWLLQRILRLLRTCTRAVRHCLRPSRSTVCLVSTRAARPMIAHPSKAAAFGSFPDQFSLPPPPI